MAEPPPVDSFKNKKQCSDAPWPTTTCNPAEFIESTSLFSKSVQASYNLLHLPYSHIQCYPSQPLETVETPVMIPLQLSHQITRSQNKLIIHLSVLLMNLIMRFLLLRILSEKNLSPYSRMVIPVQSTSQWEYLLEVLFHQEVDHISTFQYPPTSPLRPSWYIQTNP